MLPVDAGHEIDRRIEGARKADSVELSSRVAGFEGFGRHGYGERYENGSGIEAEVGGTVVLILVAVNVPKPVL